MPLTVLSLRVPRESENTRKKRGKFLASLPKAAPRPGFFPNLFGHQPVYLSLEVTLVDGQIVFTIVFPPHLSTFVQSQMLATYPDVVMAPIPDYLSSWPDHPAVKLSLIRQAFASYFPLRDYADYKEVDPMLPLLGVLSKAGTDDKILIQFVLSPPARNIQKNAYSYLHPKSSLGPDGKPQKVPPPEGKKLIEDKLSQPFVGVSIRFATTKPELLYDLHGAVSVLNRPDGNSLIPSRLLPWYPRRLWRAVVSRTPFSSLTVPPATLNVMELSSLWHLPGVYTKLPIVSPSSKKIPLTPIPTSLLPLYTETSRLLSVSNFPTVCVMSTSWENPAPANLPCWKTWPSTTSKRVGEEHSSILT